MKHTFSLLGVVIAHASPRYAAGPDPAEPGVPAPAQAYRSVFEGYRPAAEEPLADWRALNGSHLGAAASRCAHRDADR
jgi:hypothetical protein